VVVVGNRIAALGKTGKVRVPKGAQVVDATGKYLIPGLWDMHVHVFAKRSQEKYDFPLFIANGVTSIREMWTKVDQMPQVNLWRKEFYEHPGTLPRFAAVGTLVDGLPNTWKDSDTVSTADEARLMVDKLKAGGVDFVKVYNNLSREAYFAIAAEARKQRIPFAGHVPERILWREASDAGQRSIEHLTGIANIYYDCPTIELMTKKEFPNGVPKDSPDRPLIEQALELCDEKKAFALFQHLAKNGTWQVPTLILQKTMTTDAETLYRDDRLKYIPGGKETFRGDYWGQYRRTPAERDSLRMKLQRSFRVVRMMHRAGVKFMAGTDVGNPYLYPGFSLHDELALFVEAGFTPMEALQTATRNPAEFLGMLDSLGTIEKGKLADLVLLEANPLDNISNTQRINAVVVNGRYLSKETLRKMLTDAEANARKK
jgi:imidazolonepropionase-like amidohydrolase